MHTRVKLLESAADEGVFGKSSTKHSGRGHAAVGPGGAEIEFGQGEAEVGLEEDSVLDNQCAGDQC